MTKTLASNGDWSAVQKRSLIVTSFTPASGAARASITLEGEDVPAGTTGMVFHKKDAEHLAAAFAERNKGDDRLVMIEWGTDHLTGIKKLFAPFMPRLTVGVFTEAAYALLSNEELQPELGGYDRFLASKPIAMWEPMA